MKILTKNWKSVTSSASATSIILSLRAFKNFYKFKQPRYTRWNDILYEIYQVRKLCNAWTKNNKYLNVQRIDFYLWEMNAIQFFKTGQGLFVLYGFSLPDTNCNLFFFSILKGEFYIEQNPWLALNASILCVLFS